MNGSQILAVLTLLNREMFKRKSWCGETHIQKATFFLQDLLGVKLGFDFVLYRHGPFSFDLRDELSLMQANDLVVLQIRQLGYGATFVPSQFSETFLERFPKTISRYSKQVEFVSGEFSPMNVTELERIATAFFITEHEEERSVNKRAEMLVNLKPHIQFQDAVEASKYVDLLIEKAMPIRLTNEFDASSNE